MDNRALISISKKKNMEKDALIYILFKIICVDVSWRIRRKFCVCDMSKCGRGLRGIDTLSGHCNCKYCLSTNEKQGCTNYPVLKEIDKAFFPTLRTLSQLFKFACHTVSCFFLLLFFLSPLSAPIPSPLRLLSDTLSTRTVKQKWNKQVQRTLAWMRWVA